ncbi:MAG: hypothetical protein KF802_10365 [Bdellovibrionaceae bacterium]|nr:hypothetical protein [Pseudobdellovibrionaceae bacterium]MBX3033813.1 hypothetical protein [Pseudobdellovibrionaceae bacterium]
MLSRQSTIMILAASLGFVSNASAAVLTKMNNTRTRVIVSGPELQGARIGDRLILSNLCELRVTTVANGKVAADTSTCRERRHLRLGASVSLVPGLQTEYENVYASDNAASSQMRTMINPNSMLPSSHLVKGFSVGAGVSNISKKGSWKSQDYTISGGYNFPVGIQSEMKDSGSSTKGNVNLNYSWIPRGGFGFTADLSISQVDQIISPDTYTFIRPAVNLAFGATDRLFAFAGANYTAYNEAPGYADGMFKDKTVKLKPDVGWQAGGGLIFTKNIQAQIQYSWSRLSFDEKLELNNGYMIGNYGRRIQGSYEFSGVDASLQYRF